MPLIVLTTDRPPELRDVGAGQTDRPAADVRAVRQVVRRGRHAPAHAERLRWIRQLACRAVWTALGGRARARPPQLPAARAARARRAAAAGRPGRAAAARGWRARPRRRGDPIRRCTPRWPAAAARSIVAGRAERGDRRPVVARAGRAGRCSPTRCRGRAADGARSPTTTRCCATRLRRGRCGPTLVLRIGDLPTSKPLRAWLAGLDGVPQWRSTPRAPGTTRPASVSRGLRPGRRARHLRAAPLTAQAAGPRLARRPTRAPPRRWTTSCATRSTSQRRPRAGHRGRARRAGPDRGVDADPRRRDVLAVLDAPPRALANRGANGIDGTLATAYGVAAGARRADLRAARRRRVRP